MKGPQRLPLQVTVGNALSRLVPGAVSVRAQPIRRLPQGTDPTVSPLTAFKIQEWQRLKPHSSGFP